MQNESCPNVALMALDPKIRAQRNGVLSPRIKTAFGSTRDLLGNRFVYTVISSRAHGISVGVNMNPDKACNFDCVYCEVNRLEPALETELDVEIMEVELERTLALVLSSQIR